MARRTYKRRHKGGNETKKAKPKPNPKPVSPRARIRGLERTGKKIVKYTDILTRNNGFNIGSSHEREIDDLAKLFGSPAKKRVEKARLALTTRKARNAKEKKRLTINQRRNMENYDKLLLNR